MIKKINAKEREIEAIKVAVAAEKEHSVSLQKRMVFYEQLLQKGIIPAQTKIESEKEYYHSISQLNIYHIQLERTKGEQLQLVDELARSGSQEKHTLAEIQQQKFMLQQQVINASAGMKSHLIAPFDGIITSMTLLESQRVTAGMIAAILVPENARSFVELWVPPAALQEIKAGQRVMMRVASLPWEWFGKVSGTVLSVSSSPKALTGNKRNFRVLIIPDDQKEVLPAGVEVEADILTRYRRIWEWLFLPIKQGMNRIIERR